VSGVNLPATVAANGSLTLTVSFAPTTAGPYSDTLTVLSNATNSTLTVGLSGTALHGVTLSWTDGSGSVRGYNVYRSAQSGTGYAMLNSSLIAGQTYCDGAVSGGQTYYYVVTAVSESGVESAYSSQVTAVVPTT
jgi:fibronectin type 3 domain-containing protein